jgi:AcrR family transcriptional regulator
LKVIVKETGSVTTEPTKRGAGGRPSTSRKGEVDARLLDAATRLFLTLGFDGTSCDQVAVDARAGKASIYARYPNKTALFADVVETNLARLFAPADAVAAPGQPLRARLAAVGASVLHDALQPDAVALLRLLVAEAHRLPNVAGHADQVVLRLGMRRVAEAIAARTPDDAGVERATVPAARFIDLALAPVLLRALLGEAPATLLDGRAQRVADAIDVLEAAGALGEWERI